MGEGETLGSGKVPESFTTPFPTKKSKSQDVVCGRNLKVFGKKTYLDFFGMYFFSGNVCKQLNIVREPQKRFFF